MSDTNLKCSKGRHNWHYCKCLNCGKLRISEHLWEAELQNGYFYYASNFVIDHHTKFAKELINSGVANCIMNYQILPKTKCALCQKTRSAEEDPAVCWSCKGRGYHLTYNVGGTWLIGTDRSGCVGGHTCIRMCVACNGTGMNPIPMRKWIRKHKIKEIRKQISIFIDNNFLLGGRFYGIIFILKLFGWAIVIINVFMILFFKEFWMKVFTNLIHK